MIYLKPKPEAGEQLTIDAHGLLDLRFIFVRARLLFSRLKFRCRGSKSKGRGTRPSKPITVSTRKYSIRAATGHLRNCGFVSQPWLMFLAGPSNIALPRAES